MAPEAVAHTDSAPSRFHPGELQLQVRAGAKQQALQLPQQALPRPVVLPEVKKRGRGRIACTRVQERLGTRELVIRSGFERGLTKTIRGDHVTLLAAQPLFYVAFADADARVWASVLMGPPGFINVSDARTVTISPLRIVHGDPLAGSLAVGKLLGGAGHEAHTRRRCRVNTRVAAFQPPDAHTGAPGSLELAVVLSFGGCPKHIQSRTLEFDWDRWQQVGSPAPHAAVEQGQERLGAAQCALVGRSDTMFLASGFEGPVPEGTPDDSVGYDVSHRGGPQGFVHVETDDGPGTVLKWADYSGNNLFTSLGNLALNPRAGLLFVDHDAGDTLQLTGEVAILYDDRSLPGAQRVIAFHVHAWVHVPGALPLRQVGALDPSPYNVAVENQQCCDKQQQHAGQGRAAAALVTCVGVRDEAEGVKTFEFTVPHTHPAQKHLYAARQHATFVFPPDHFPGGGGTSGAPVQRSWTVSCHPDHTEHKRTFTVAIKKAGLVSSWMHDHVRPGQALRLQGFAGEGPFVVAPATSTSGGGDGGAPRAGEAGGVLLLAGGIGVTPLCPILQDLVNEVRRQPRAALPRRVAVVYAVRRAAQAALAGELHKLAEAARDVGVDVRLVLALTGGEGGSAPPASVALPQVGPRWTVVSGRPSVALLRQHVVEPMMGAGEAQLAGWRAYVCGPAGMVADADGVFAALGVPPENRHSDAFNF